MRQAARQACSTQPYLIPKPKSYCFFASYRRKKKRIEKRTQKGFKVSYAQDQATESWQGPQVQRD